MKMTLAPYTTIRYVPVRYCGRYVGRRCTHTKMMGQLTMKFARRERSSAPCVGGRMIRTILFCVVCSMALRWTQVLISFSPSQPQNSLLSPPQPSKNVVIANANQNDNSSTMHNATDKNEVKNNIDVRNNLRANTSSQRTLSEFNQPSTYRQTETAITSLIYPLHAKSGTHHAYLYIGTPPQRQTLIVDTGSRLTAFPCQPHCPDCGTHASDQFHLDASTSHTIVPCDECKLDQVDFPLEEYMAGDGIGGNSGDGPSLLRGAVPNNQLKIKNQQQQKTQRNLFPTSCVNNKCGIDQRYTEGSSWKAFEVQDKVWLGHDDAKQSVETHAQYATPFVFGCQISEQGLFKTQYADGIMGLSMYTQTLVGTWYEQGKIDHESFSLCLNRNGGHISLGGTPNDEHNLPMQYTPFAKQQVWYYTVSVTSISVGSHVLPKSILQFVNDHKGTIVDSGTTDTFISHKVAQSFIFAWEKITKRKYNNRLQTYTYEEFNELPVITFELEGGIQWEITPEAYMEDVEVAKMRDVKNTNDNANIHDPDVRWEGKRAFISRVYVDEPHGVVLGSNASKLSVI